MPAVGVLHAGYTGRTSRLRTSSLQIRGAGRGQVRIERARRCLMAWVTLIGAGVFETAFAVLLKLSHGLTRPWPTVGFAVAALVSFGLLTLALRQLEVGPAYAVWTGIGAVGTAALGMLWLGESVSLLKLVSIGLILAGVIGLNLSGVTL